MADERRPPENHLLAVLSEADWARLEPHPALIDMPLGLPETSGRGTHPI
jgi:hypothetical protein